jgi:hypothetical protein
LSKALSSNPSTAKKKKKKKKSYKCKNESIAGIRGGRIKENGGEGEFKYDIFGIL